MERKIDEDHKVQTTISVPDRWDLICYENDKVFMAVEWESFDECPYCGEVLTLGIE